MATDRNGRTIGIGDDYIVIGPVVGVTASGNVIIDAGPAPILVKAADVAYIDQLGGGGGGGVTDHGALTGLADNDHPQYAQVAENLADLANAGTARTNLGLGDSATKNTGTTAGTVAAGDHTHTVSQITDAGDSAKLDVGTTAGTVASGDHVHDDLLKRDGSNAATADLDAGGFKITQLGNPAALADAVNLGYLSGALSGYALASHGHADLDALQTDGAPLFGHSHPFLDDFFDQTQWNGNTGGTGTSFQVGVSNFSWLSGSLGAVRLACGAGTASTDYRALRPAQLLSATVDYDASASEWIFGWRVGTNGSTDMRCRVGCWAATITGVSADAGFSFEWDTDSTANVQCRVHDGTTPADTDSGITAASFNGALRWCEIRLSSAGATFRIDGSTVATVTTGLPTGANSLVYPQIAVAGAGTAWRSIVIDTFVMAYAPGNGIEALI